MRKLKVSLSVVGVAFHVFVLTLSRKQYKACSSKSTVTFELYSFELETEMDIASLSS
jgi:hypothetical protein